MMKRTIPLLLALLLVCGLTVSALAAEVPDLSRSGSITFLLDWEGEPLNSGSLTMYRVGRIAEYDGNYDFALVEELADSGVSLENLDDAQLPGTLAALAPEKELPGLTAPIAEGRAVFSDLELGLYVVVQQEPCRDFAPINPFLISIPRYENEVYHYDITAYPKVPLETAPTEPSEPSEPTEPSKPTEPDLPQTGQNNWRVPAMAISGLLLAALGIVLCAGRKRT